MQNYPANVTPLRAKHQEWKPSPELQEQIAEAIRSARKRIIAGTAPQLDDVWLDDNFEVILLHFAACHDQKAVAGLMGVPWSEWSQFALKSEKFRNTLEIGQQLRLVVLEEMRNSACRGGNKGSVAAITHALDRQHGDVYFARPGTFKPGDEDEEMPYDVAVKVLEGYGITEDD